MDLRDLKGLSSENMRALYEIRNILVMEETYFGLHRLLEDACRRCSGDRVYCGYEDKGALQYDYYDNYWHLCLDCLDARHKEKFLSCGSVGAASFAICSFCNYNWTGSR